MGQCFFVVDHAKRERFELGKGEWTDDVLDNGRRRVAVAVGCGGGLDEYTRRVSAWLGEWMAGRDPARCELRDDYESDALMEAWCDYAVTGSRYE